MGALLDEPVKRASCAPLRLLDSHTIESIADLRVLPDVLVVVAMFLSATSMPSPIVAVVAPILDPSRKWRPSVVKRFEPVRRLDCTKIEASIQVLSRNPCPCRQYEGMIAQCGYGLRLRGRVETGDMPKPRYSVD